MNDDDYDALAYHCGELAAEAAYEKRAANELRDLLREVSKLPAGGELIRRARRIIEARAAFASFRLNA